MNCAISSALAPATTSPFPPLARDCSTSGGPRPCWSSWKPHDGTSPHVREHRLYLLARVLTEPPSSSLRWNATLGRELSAGCTGQQSAVCSSPDGRFSPLFDSAGILSARSLR